MELHVAFLEQHEHVAHAHLEAVGAEARARELHGRHDVVLEGARKVDDAGANVGRAGRVAQGTGLRRGQPALARGPLEERAPATREAVPKDRWPLKCRV